MEYANQFAVWVRAAMAARENSFDKAASKAAQDAADIERQKRLDADDPTYLYCVVDHSTFYTLSEREAVASVVPAEMVEPVYLLLVTAWNDIQYWCDATQGVKVKAVPQTDDDTDAETDDPSAEQGRDFNFELTFDPGQKTEQKCQYQVWAPNMLNAAVQVGQVFAEKFAHDFVVVPKPPVILKMVKA